MKLLSRLGAAVLGVAGLGLFVAEHSLRSPHRTETTRHPAQAMQVQLSGGEARAYLEQCGDGKSLAEALTAARFGLERQKDGDYLGTSHEQNLRAWFGPNGVTVKPTLPEEKRDQEWTTGLHLKGWGYGKQLADVPPIISRKVRENRIEYERDSANPRSAFRIPPLVEWYENRAEGIEQGFTLNERPTRRGAPEPNESLRVLLTVSGDLRALELDDGNGASLESNDNWVDSPNKQAIIDSGIPPNHDLESAIVRTLPLGTYTAIVRGFGGSTGVAVVEMYVLP